MSVATQRGNLDLQTSWHDLSWYFVGSVCIQSAVDLTYILRSVSHGTTVRGGRKVMTYHILVPLMTHLSPVLTALVLTPATSEPAPGSVYGRSTRLFWKP